MAYRDMMITCEQCGKQFVFTVEEQRRLVDRGSPLTPPTVCEACQDVSGPIDEPVEGPGPHEGTVKWYSEEKGYGFILQQNGNEIFFHRSGIAPDGPRSFADGVRVTYLIEQSDRGPQAVEVALMED